MLKKMIPLEWKAFSRAASFKFNLIVKIFFILGVLYLIGLFIALGILSYFLLEENGLPPFETINKYLIYYCGLDLGIRFFLQKLPMANIRPLLVSNIKRKDLVDYFLGKTIISIFNSIHFFFFIPLFGVLIYEGLPFLQVASWILSMLLLIYCLNFINLLISSRPVFFYVVLAIIGVVGALQYFDICDLTVFTELFFKSFYNYPVLFLLPLSVVLGLYKVTRDFYVKNLYLDAGFTKAIEEVKTEDFRWLDRFGKQGAFLKNDLKMIKRNQRPRKTLLTSFAFLFMGLLSFGELLPGYDNDFMYVVSALLITGSFLLSFGQFVPSWDSSYYALIMCQNIRYRDYLMAKWWLMIIGTLVSMVLSSFYLYYGWQVYALILACGLFNMGINSYLVLWGGAYVKTPIDIERKQQLFGDKQAFNLKTLLVSIPKVFGPIVIFLIFDTFLGFNGAVIALALVGVIGLFFRNRAFDLLENLYKSEKYDTIKAYKQKN